MPEIEARLRQHSLPSLRLLQLTMRHGVHAYQTSVLAALPIEIIRRNLRRLIVHVAKALWAGHPVAPVFRQAGRTTRVRANSPTYATDPAVYRFWRTTYAPTEILHTFLFPAWLLADAPCSCAYQDATWLPDPTLEMTVRASRRHAPITNGQIVEAARMMLDRLTVVDKTVFSDGGYGPKVTTWVDAASEYHKDRLWLHMQQGSVVRMAHVPPKKLQLPRFDSVHHLRCASGLLASRDLNCERPLRGRALEMPEASCLPEVGVRDLGLFFQSEKQMAHLRGVYRARLRSFNRIVWHTCYVCPISHDVFDPPGIEGLFVSQHAASQVERTELTLD